MDAHRQHLHNCPHCKRPAINPQKYHECIVCAQRYHIICYHRDIQVPHRAHFTCIICDRDRWRAEALRLARSPSPTSSAAASESAASEALATAGSTSSAATVVAETSAGVATATARARARTPDTYL
ncbi:hypothetical protein MBANPS3_012573, partial [Mucor bainieri]